MEDKCICHKFDNEIRIVPLSDTHLGASNCNLKEIKKAIKYIQENENVYCTLGGDILDNAVLVGKNLGVFDSNMSPMEAVNYAVELFRPIKDKILAVVSGNHEARSEKVVGINPLYLICSELGIQDVYRDADAIIAISLGDRHTTNAQCYFIQLHHGTGTSKNALTKDEVFANYTQGVDCIITGHTHKAMNTKFKVDVLNPFTKTRKSKKITVVITNSFLDDANYARRSMLTGTLTDLTYVDLKMEKEKRIETIY